MSLGDVTDVIAFFVAVCVSVCVHCVCWVSLGDVTDVMVAVDRDTKESKGFAFVVFAQEAQVREG